MIGCAQSLHLASVFAVRDFTTAVLAVMADVWRAMAGIGTDDTEKSTEEESGGIDAVLIR